VTPDALRERVPALVPGASVFSSELARGQAVIVIAREHAGDALRILREHPDLRFDQLMDVTAVDYPGRAPRFEVVYQLRSLIHGHRLRVKIGVPEDDATIPTASGLWKSALWGEREAWDMFGIRFTGHPDLRRILMYAEFEGFPLRKDYPLMKRQPLVPERDPVADPWPNRTSS
jgi:NADH-quinone oxidoreductase subunit C